VTCPHCGGEFPSCPYCGSALVEPPDRPAREERKAVTVLFADLVGDFYRWVGATRYVRECEAMLPAFA
jgi:hypothetical protein